MEGISWGRAMSAQLLEASRPTGAQTGTTVFLIVNPFIFLANRAYCRLAAGGEFIFTLAMALSVTPAARRVALAVKPSSSV